MNAESALELTEKLIPFRSLSGKEGEVVRFLTREFEMLGWKPEILPVEPGRDNIFVSFGTPHTVFTTHVDVVPAPEHLFTPRREGNRLYGRGAVDAKGIAATMIVACRQLLADGAADFGLLLVVGEELDGCGARAAAAALRGRGIRAIVNGEPTEGAVAVGHKGGLGFRVRYTGKPCHSGYPDEGVDANRLAIEGAARLLGVDYGSSEIFGRATLNLGCISGGTAGNIISPYASLEGVIRTVSANEPVVELVRRAAAPGDVEVTYDVPPTKLLEIPGLPSTVVSYCCDIPFFAPLGAEAVLFGPGSILRAHTDDEYISKSEIEVALKGCRHIFDFLKRR